MSQSPETVIQTTQLSHFYGDVPALVDLDLSVQRGEVFGFLGPNGAGKTTAIRTLLDFIRPTSGSATILGLDSMRDSVAIRKRIGYLPSELTLLNNWTGVQYIRWLNTLYERDGLPEAQRLAQLLDFDIARSLKGMSTGMKRKMGLIAVMAHKPELLILDEPTSGLDPLMQQAFNRLVREARDEGRTVFLSSHNLAEVEHICDRVGIIRAGRLQAVETITNLTRVTFRWLTLTFDQPLAQNGFGAIPGVTEVSADGAQVKMRVSGKADMNEIVQHAARHTVRDINMQYPTLEEIFLAYYGADQEA